MVGIVSLARARRPDRAGAQGQSQLAVGAGGAAPGPRKRLCRGRCVLPDPAGQLLGEPQQDPLVRPRCGRPHPEPLLHAAHRSAAGVLCTRSVGRHAAAGRILDGAGRARALSARSHLPDPDLERRRGGGSGGVVARPDRGDRRDHQDRHRRARDPAAPVRAGSGRPRRRRGTGGGAGPGEGEFAAAAKAIGERSATC